MELERILAAFGSVASLISLPLAVASLAPDRHNKDKVTLDLFRSFTTAAERWKNVHAKYHGVLFHDLGKLNQFFVGKQLRDIPINLAQDQMKSLWALKSSCSTFSRDIETYISLSRSVNLDDAQVSEVISKIRNNIDDGYSIKAKITFDAQKDAINNNDIVCEYMSKITPIYFKIDQRTPLNAADMRLVFNGYPSFYTAYNNVIVSTDVILLNVIDFYKLISESH